MDKQRIDGDDNVQISAGGDVVSAVGKGALAAGGDINIGIPPEIHADLLAKYNILQTTNEQEKATMLAKLTELETELARMKSSSSEAEQRQFAERVVQISQTIPNQLKEGFNPSELIQIGYAAQLSGNLKEAESYFSHAMDRSKALGSKPLLAASMDALGVNACKQRRLEAATKWHEESLDIATKIDHDQLIGMALNNLSVVELYKENTKKAEMYLKMSVELAEKMGNLTFQASALGNLGNLAYDKDKWTEAKGYYEQALTIIHLLDTELSVTSIQLKAGALDNLGIIARHEKKPNESRRLHMESLKIKTRLGDVQGCYYSLANLGVLEASLNNLSQAEQHFLKSLEIVRTVGDKGGEGEILIKLRNLMIHQNRTSESEKYLNQIELLQHETGMRFLPNEE
jgi:tetratricopeptide (TPR) repeat protein